MLDHRTISQDAVATIEAGYDFLSAEFRELYARSDATAFQAPLWLHMLHSELMPRLSARPHTVIVRNRQDRSLIAVLPLALTVNMGVTLLQPVDFGLCDYNAVIAETSVLAALADDPIFLRQLEGILSAGDLFLFRKTRNDGFDIARLFPRSAISPCENAAYHVEVGDDFEEWQRRTLRKAFTKNLRRLQRQLETHCGSYEHRLVTDKAEIRAAFGFLKEVRNGVFADDLLADPAYFDFYVSYAVAAAKTGEASLYVSYAGGRPVAVLFGLTGDGDFHAVQIGLDSANYEKYSVGNQILYQVIKSRFDQGHRLFDMGLGNTGYKSHFRVGETALRNVSRSLSLRGAIVGAVYHHAKPLKNVLRRLTPQLH